MSSVRYILNLVFLVFLVGITPPQAYAFWGFGNESRADRSGLDFDKGYDVNTVTTITGRVISLSGEGNDQFFVEVDQGGGSVFVMLAPKNFWDTTGMGLVNDHQLTVRGAKAQGKDGKIYIISQQITDNTSGRSVTLRSDTGAPLWGHGVRNQDAGRSFRTGGGGMRGSGTIRHGGGMRR